MRSKTAVFLTMMAMGMALGAAACDGGPAALPDLAVATMAVEPEDAELVIGDTLTLTAFPRASDGVVLGAVAIEWEVEGPADATVLGNGYLLRVTALEPGAVVVTAISEGKSAEAALTIVAGLVEQVTLDADSVVLAEGGTRRVVATARDADGNVVTGRHVQWTSSDPDLAHVDPLGTVTAIRTGSLELTARVDGRTATIPVRVFADYPFDLLYTVWSDPSTPAVFRLDLRDPTAAYVRVTPATGRAGSPAASPDGARIAFSGTSPEHGTGIFVMDVDGGDPVLIDATDTAACGQIAWSPDGLRLAYMCQVPGSDADIVTIDADGGNRRVLTADDVAHYMWPSWSPAQEDGSYRIACARTAAGTPTIWTMNADGTDRRQVTTGHDDQPAWSPDGSTIVFQRMGAAIFADLYLVDADGSDVRPLLPAPLAGPQDHPKWSPDGALIAFVSRHETYGHEDGPTRIYTVWADGTKLARRTHDDAEKAGPAWLPR